MKIIEISKRALEVIGLREIEKRDGVYVSRPLEARNAKKWHDWAVKHGVPNVLPPEEMHVTIIYSSVDAKVPLVETGLNISTTGYGGGCFAMFGKDEEHLVFTFRSWELHERHWAFLEHGCVCDWPTYRPHVTISNDAAGFELSDDALQDVPSYVVLGPEVSAAPRAKSEIEKDAGDSLVEVSDELRAAAAEMVKSSAEKMSAIDAYDLADISHGRLSEGVAKRLAAADWAPEELKKAFTTQKTELRKKVETEYTVAIRAVPEEITKKIGTSVVAKSNEDEQIVLGIASVSTVNGELVEDLHGDKITTQALVEFNRSLIAGSRAGKFDHEGEAVTEVVAGLVLTQDWQKSLGIDLGFEPYLVEIHVPDPKDWAEVKEGEWMLSIAGTMWHYEVEV